MTTSTMMKKLSIATAGAACIALGTTGAAQAATFFEKGDAGDFLNSVAQVAEVGPGETLDSIAGFLSSYSSGESHDIDMFQVKLKKGFFSASTRTGPISGSRSLFLFDANGLAIAANKGNGVVAALQGTLVEAGTYFLGIGSGLNFDWRNSVGSIFTDSDMATPEFGATGSGAGKPPTSVGRGGKVTGGDYIIAIRNGNDAAIKNDTTQPVPEPASVLGLVAVGALGAGSARKRKKKQESYNHSLN